MKIENKQTKQNQKEIWLPDYLYFNLLQVIRTFRVNVAQPVVGHIYAITLKRGFKFDKFDNTKKRGHFGFSVRENSDRQWKSYHYRF